MRLIRVILYLFVVSGAYNISFGQCPTILPNVSDTCFLGPQAINLSASGGTNVYSWYDAPTNGNFLGNSNTFNAGIVNTTTAFYVASQEENFSLDFDGANDRVAIQNYSYNTSGMTELTVEAWVKTTTTSAMVIASFDRSDYWRLGIGSTGASSGRVSWNVNTNAGYLDMGGGILVNDGQWHHVAGTFNAGIARIYVDGILDATSSLGSTWGSGTTRYGFIGVGSEANTFNGSIGPNSYMNGEVDELRVWSEARTASELTNNMDNCLLGTEPNLEIYYKLNDGTGSGTITDEVSNATGTMIHMNSTTDWVLNNTNYSCPSCESARVMLTVTINNVNPLSISGGAMSASCIGGVPILDAGSGFATYLWNTGETTQTVSAAISGVYAVEVTDLGCTAKDSVDIVLEGGHAQTSAEFDGNNDFVAIQSVSYASSTISELSVEAWIKTTDAGNQIIASFDRSEYWRLGINGDGAGNGQVCWNIRTSGGILDFGSVTRVDDGEWHHVVGTYNSGVASIYIDGTLDATANRGATIGTGVVRFGFIGTGSEATSYNGTRGPSSYFDGEIEELRIWSKALSLAEIREQMCQNYTGGSVDLEAYFKFNEGVGTVVNSEVNGVSSQAFNINTNNFWTNSGAPIGDHSVYLYPGSWTGSSVSITSCSGTQLTVSDIVSSAEGIQLYVLEGDPENLTGIDSFTVGNHYYGVFWPKSETSNYNASVDYNNHLLVNSSNEVGLSILTREDKTVNTFSQQTATNNTQSNTIVANLNDRNELILDAYYYIWTGTIDTDWATSDNWEPTNVPPFMANVLVPDVINQPVLDGDRVISSLKLESGASIDLNGNTLEHRANLIADGTIHTSDGELLFSGTMPQYFVAGVEQTIDNLTSTNPSEVTLENEKIRLRNTLHVEDGNLITNDSLILISDALGTARIDEISGGGSILGEIEMQRYIDAGETYWRFFSSAVEGATVADFEGDFITSGYVGSDFPSFPFNSVYTYSEGIGYVAVSNANQVIGQGEGLMVWSGDTITGTDPFVVDYRGVPNQGNISMPVSFSNNDGWNLVGNPYASTIDWDSPNWTKTNMANSIYVLNPDTEQYATYINGASANGGSNLVASQQAFWVGSIGASPVLTARESVKSAVDQPFLKAGSAISSGVHIVINGNGMTDEAVLRHVDNATDAYDWEFDATKKIASWTNFPHISVLNSTGQDFTVHSFDKAFQEWTIPLRAVVFQNGNYNIVFNDIHELDVPCIKLEDTYTGQMYTIEEGIPLSFNLSDTSYVPRFLLHIGKNYNITTSEPSCSGLETGVIEVLMDSLESGNFDLTSSLYAESGSINGPLIIDSLPAGSYELFLDNLNGLCQNTIVLLTINEPLPLLIDAEVFPEIYGNDGAIETSISGGSPQYSYLWSTGDTTLNLYHLEAGYFGLTVVDNNGCSTNSSYGLISVLGVDKVNESDTEFLYFPNENKIKLSGILEEKYQLTDVSGRVISEFIVDVKANSTELTISTHLSKGVYLLTGIKSSYKILR